MPHTNLKLNEVPSDFMHEHCSKIEAELSYWRKLANGYYDELTNIPKAIKQYGYINIYDHNGNELCTLGVIDDPQT